MTNAEYTARDPGRGLQTFVISFTPTAAFAPTDTLFTFVCLNSARAPIYVGVNTLLLSASSAPVPDVIALVATPDDNGVASLPGANGTAAFAVATVTVGVGGSITYPQTPGARHFP